MSITIPDAVVAAMQRDGYAELTLWASVKSDEWKGTVWYRSQTGYPVACSVPAAASPQAALDALAAKLEARGD